MIKEESMDKKLNEKELEQINGGENELNPKIKTLEGDIEEYVIPLSKDNIESTEKR